MDKFRTYLKSIKPAGVAALAKAVGTSPGQLWQIAGGHRLCREKLAIEIEKATNKAICVEDLRPDVDWGYLRDSEPCE